MENKELVITRNGSGWEVFLEGKASPVITSKNKVTVIHKAQEYAQQNHLSLYSMNKAGVKYYWGALPSRLNVDILSKSIIDFKKMKIAEKASGNGHK